MNELIAKTQSEYKNVLSQADSIEDFNKRFVIDGVPFKLIEKEEMKRM